MERYKSRFNEATLGLIKTSKGYVLDRWTKSGRREVNKKGVKKK